MSKVGIQCCKYSVMDENGKYTGPKDGGTLVSYNGSPNKVEAEDWGNNSIVESNKSINKINLSMELNDLEEKSTQNCADINTTKKRNS